MHPILTKKKPYFYHLYSTVTKNDDDDNGNDADNVNDNDKNCEVSYVFFSFSFSLLNDWEACFHLYLTYSIPSCSLTRSLSLSGSEKKRKKNNLCIVPITFYEQTQTIRTNVGQKLFDIIFGGISCRFSSHFRLVLCRLP